MTQYSPRLRVRFCLSLPRLHRWQGMLLACTLLIVAPVAYSRPAASHERSARNQTELQSAITLARPGDSIVLENGEWRDVDIALAANGTAGAPITLRARTAGGVALVGRSTIRVAGRHLIVRDIVFRDGQPRDEGAIVTRIGDRWAENLRLTGIVIDDFSNADRRKEDHWVVLYGRDIRVDHSLFRNKRNAGALFVVARMPGWPLDNRVRIDHNHFGPRPPLGSNGGETIRIGTSDESLSDALSIVEDNIFERCDGEVEIVSIKSGGNIVRRNLFLQSQGAVVLRHGNGNLVEANVFLGRSGPNTGGVRVINQGQIVRNNYMEGLTGSSFTGALTVMNGVPNSTINRYHQVRGAVISNNTIVNPSAIIFGAGASAERSLAPADVTVARNLVISENAPFRVDASTHGIRFVDNVANAKVPASVGFLQTRIAMRRASNGLLYPVDGAFAALGAPRSLTLPVRATVGPQWYRAAALAESPIGRSVRVSSATELQAAVVAARDGDVIALRAGAYMFEAPLVLRHAMTLTGKGARLQFRGHTLFEIAEGGSVTLRGLAISGESAPASVGNAMIRTQAVTMLANYSVDIVECRFSDMAGSPGFDLIATTPGTFAAHVRIAASEIQDLSGTALAAARLVTRAGGIIVGARGGGALSRRADNHRHGQFRARRNGRRRPARRNRREHVRTPLRADHEHNHRQRRGAAGGCASDADCRKPLLA